MPTDIFLVRHGETESNRLHINMGRSDDDLNASGYKQVERLSTRLQVSKIDSVYSSPLKRAKDTAGIIAGPRHLPVKLVDDLTEIDIGEWTRLPLVEIRQKWPDLLERWRENPAQVSVPGGENFNQVAQRAQRALKAIISDNPDATVLIVSHEIVIKTIIMQALEATFHIYRRFEIGNASLSQLTFREGNLLVITINEKFHLAGPV